MPSETHHPVLHEPTSKGLHVRPFRGRTLFRRAEPVLRLCVALLRTCPRPLCSWFFVLSRHMPTIMGVGLRYILLVRLCKRCGSCVAIYEGAYLHGLSEIEFGDNVSIHPMAYIEGHGGLIIGNNVSVAHGTTLMTTEHDFSQSGVCTRDAPVIKKGIVVSDDVWLGCGVRVLAGVEIGESAVVGAGAVVTRHVSAFTVVSGVPARVIRAHTKETSTPTRQTA